MNWKMKKFTERAKVWTYGCVFLQELFKTFGCSQHSWKQKKLLFKGGLDSFCCCLIRIRVQCHIEAWKSIQRRSLESWWFGRSHFQKEMKFWVEMKLQHVYVNYSYFIRWFDCGLTHWDSICHMEYFNPSLEVLFYVFTKRRKEKLSFIKILLI